MSISVGVRCAIAIPIAMVLSFGILSYGADKMPNTKQVLPTVDFKAEIQNGKELIAWIKARDDQTEIQREAEFAKLKGKYVILRGEVREVGKTLFAERAYVSLRVGKFNMLEDMNVQFNVPDSLKNIVAGWKKGETHVMRGRITETGDLVDDASCSNASIVTEEQYAGGSGSGQVGQITPGMATQKNGLETSRPLESDLTKNAGEPSRQSPQAVGFKAEIKNGEELIAWIKARDDQTEIQREAEFAKLKGKYVILRGEVREVGKTLFTERAYVSLRVGKLDMLEDMNVQFNVPDSLKNVVAGWKKGETRIMRGRITETGDLVDDASCSNGSIVTEEQYIASRGR